MSTGATMTSTPATPAPPVATQPQPLAGTARLLRLMIRRDRIPAALWVLGIALFVLLGSASVVSLYSTPEQLKNYAELTHNNAAVQALLGPGYGLDHPTQGAAVMDEMELLTFIVIALMSMFLVVRHTRAEEESGRAELIRAAPVGRLAALVATSGWVIFLNLVTAVAVAISVIALGLPVSGSLAFAAAGMGFGLVFVGVAAVSAQVSSSSRAASAGAGIVLGGCYLLRAVGDVGNGWLTWLSPLGWAQGIRAYADERWWVLLLLLGATVLLLTAAVALSARRDLGAGILPQRPGPAQAGRLLSTPLGLAVRLHRASLLGWAAGIAILGFFLGLLADEADTLAENESVADVLAPAGQGSLADSFLATMILMSALLATGFVVGAVLRVRTEESAVHADPILATPVSRGRWVGGHLAVAAGGGVLIATLVGVLTGLGAALALGEVSEIVSVLGASLAMVPALWVLAGLTLALVGWLPRWASVAWVAVGFVTVVGLLGDLLQMPSWLRSVSPFDHIPALPGAEMEWLPLAVLTLLAAVLTAFGLLGVTRRDIG